MWFDPTLKHNLPQSRLAVQHVTMVMHPDKKLTILMRLKTQGREGNSCFLFYRFLGFRTILQLLHKFDDNININCERCVSTIDIQSMVSTHICFRFWDVFSRNAFREVFVFCFFFLKPPCHVTQWLHAKAKLYDCNRHKGHICLFWIFMLFFSLILNIIRDFRA